MSLADRMLKMLRDIPNSRIVDAWGEVRIGQTNFPVEPGRVAIASLMLKGHVVCLKSFAGMSEYGITEAGRNAAQPQPAAPPAPTDATLDETATTILVAAQRSPRSPIAIIPEGVDPEGLKLRAKAMIRLWQDGYIEPIVGNEYAFKLTPKGLAYLPPVPKPDPAEVWRAAVRRQAQEWRSLADTEGGKTGREAVARVAMLRSCAADLERLALEVEA